MTDAKTGDALWKWILGGLAAGAAVLGLLVGAYEIGYDRGQDSADAAAVATEPAETTPPRTEAPPAETAPPATEAAPAETETASEANLVARGEELWASTGCAGCHSLDGSAGAGPTVQGLAGSMVTLDDGSTVTADDGYLARSITDPDAQISEGYAAGIMAGAVASQDFDTRPGDVDALVAFVKAQA